LQAPRLGRFVSACKDGSDVFGPGLRRYRSMTLGEQLQLQKAARGQVFSRRGQVSGYFEPQQGLSRVIGLTGQRRRERLHPALARVCGQGLAQSLRRGQLRGIAFPPRLDDAREYLTMRLRGEFAQSLLSMFDGFSLGPKRRRAQARPAIVGAIPIKAALARGPHRTAIPTALTRQAATTFRAAPWLGFTRAGPVVTPHCDHGSGLGGRRKLRGCHWLGRRRRTLWAGR
jgi:hypothetical protein